MQHHHFSMFIVLWASSDCIANYLPFFLAPVILQLLRCSFALSMSLQRLLLFYFCCDLQMTIGLITSSCIIVSVSLQLRSTVGAIYKSFSSIWPPIAIFSLSMSFATLLKWRNLHYQSNTTQNNFQILNWHISHSNRNNIYYTVYIFIFI